MTKELIENRIKDLKSHRDSLLKNQDQIFAELNATEGAIADSQYWLDQLNQLKPEEQKNG